MALNDLRIELNRLEEGQWFTISGIKFLIRGIDKSLSSKMDKISGKRTVADQVRAMSEFVFTDLVKDWRGMTTEKLQNKVISKELHKDSEWYELCGIKFHIKRVTPADLQEFKACTNDDAKLRKKVRTLILDWENFKYTDDDKECVPYSKKTAEEVFTKQEYRAVTKLIQEFAENASNFEETPSDELIEFSPENVERYLIDVDSNQLILDIVNCAKDEESYRQDLIEEDVELAKK